ncbi:hypothetical protein PR048_009059 [Dryococelus australis]|uniref:Uncharacterized protein n=1 Tax=Dryococelus australis TaxID=614101 RepID=A0ABQ9HYU6_9NEOP|nr:hypothetical protein PR048_009059 [Dryococelus australis]
MCWSCVVSVVILTRDEMVRKYRTVKRRGAEHTGLPEDQVDHIVGEMESDPLLMEDNPFSEQLRMLFQVIAVPEVAVSLLHSYGEQA